MMSDECGMWNAEKITPDGVTTNWGTLVRSVPVRAYKQPDGFQI